MAEKCLNDRIMERDRLLFETAKGQTPSLFNRDRWLGQVVNWAMENDEMRLRIFRFIDVFPSLQTLDAIRLHIREQFGDSGEKLPGFLKWGVRSAGFGGTLGNSLLHRAIRANIQEVARQFILGESAQEAIKGLGQLRKQGFAASAALLGAPPTDAEQISKQTQRYAELIEALGGAQSKWTALGTNPQSNRDWGSRPKFDLSIHPSAFVPALFPLQSLDGASAALEHLLPLCRRVVELEGAICLEMGTSRCRELTLEIYRRLLTEFKSYPHIGLTLQAYLHQSQSDLEKLLRWAREKELKISIRLVKGAFRDTEVALSDRWGREPEVFSRKAETDANFEHLARLILRNSDLAYLACASHNLRSCAAVLESAAELGVPEDRYEFQLQYGMAEPIRSGLLSTGARVRLYTPCGDLVTGIRYLVLRLLENTSNDSFLRRSFVESIPVEELLADPGAQPRPLNLPVTQKPSQPTGGASRLAAFAIEPSADFTRAAHKKSMEQALGQVRRQLGRSYPLFIDGHEIHTQAHFISKNPAQPGEVIGRICQSDQQESRAAIVAAKQALPAWRASSPAARVQILFSVAALARRRIWELAAWQVFEIGKQWDQAHADITEGIDYLEYYGREMLRLTELKHLSGPGEVNSYHWEPRGVCVVIAPWNFPFAISCGMLAAALATGNTLVFKPSSLTSVTGHLLTRLFREAGLPSGVLNTLPGRGETVGNLLLEHPAVSLVAFTGSLETGLKILERTGKLRPEQQQIRRVVLALGGKNAIIIDEDADFDEAIPAVLQSAFGFAGQKCSACSRLIILDRIYDAFVQRLIRAAGALKIGPPEDPSCIIGPVADGVRQKRIYDYIEIGKNEGTLLYQGEAPAEGNFVAPAIFGDILPSHRLAREEIFGPVLAVMRARDFAQALQWACVTPFALTGGVFSRSPGHLDQARREFRVGNLYLNRAITGSVVGRQPFGGAGLSGDGSQAGGPEYLKHFMDRRCITENTLRHGFCSNAE